MATRATPALTRALGHLEALRRDGALPGGHLPTVVQLARDAGVSARAMHQAVRVCAQAGVLLVRHRAGISWANPSAAVSVPEREAVPQAHAPRAASLAEEIERAVLRGAMPDPLPPAKSLRARYRAGHAAVGRALLVLAERGTLVRRGLRWVVARSESLRSASRIMMVAPSTDLADFATFGPKAADFCAILERQCTLNSTSLQFRSSIRPVEPDPSLIGYIVVASMPPDDLAAITARLSTSGRPVVVADVQGDTAIARRALVRQTSVVRIQGSRSSARQVALHLRELGHRRIACISPFNPSTTRWVADRLDGLRDVYGESAVVFCSTDTRTQAQIWNHVYTSVMQSLAPAVANLASQAHEHTGISDRGWVDEDLPHLFFARYGASQALPLFEQAAADRTLTAWVCANDACGVSALRHLARKRIDVPGVVSVAGFDGSREGMAVRLSSYDFNIPSFVDTILRLVLQPRPRHRSGEPEQIDIPGLFIGRDTVGGL